MKLCVKSPSPSLQLEPSLTSSGTCDTCLLSHPLQVTISLAFPESPQGKKGVEKKKCIFIVQ